MAKQPLLTSAQIFEKARIERVKQNKRFRILCEMGSLKKIPRQLLLTKTNLLKRQNWAKKYTKIDFSKVIITDESGGTFDGPDGLAKGGVLSNSNVAVAKRRQQRGGNVIITILCTRLSLNCTRPTIVVLKWSVYLCKKMFILIYQILPVNSLSKNDLMEIR